MTDTVVFIDIEADSAKQIHEIGLLHAEVRCHAESIAQARRFLQTCDAAFVAGHNAFAHDFRLLEQTTLVEPLRQRILIDTLPISLLLFNQKTHHRLQKCYKTEDRFENDPLKDAALTRDLLQQCIDQYAALPTVQRNVLYSLLHADPHFDGFFTLTRDLVPAEGLAPSILEGVIANMFAPVIKNVGRLHAALDDQRVELAYLLALRFPQLEVNAQPPRVLYDRPGITELADTLCFDADRSDAMLETYAADVFGFGTFKSFPRLDATLEHSDVSQREIARAALDGTSFLAVLPTGGGKTFTFWLPALIRADAVKSLTVVISPLQALIKDHISTFHERVADYTCVALSGFQSPSERADAFEKVASGVADLLYIAPESLRSQPLFTLLKNRVIERFVIDEAHCLSTWGNDFRHDYFYIAGFIRDLLEAKPFQDHIPVSCFTATAKPRVMDDISDYFATELDMTLARFVAVPERTNLDYAGFDVGDPQSKYAQLLTLVADNEVPTLIYIPSSTKKCDEIAEMLARDTGRHVRAFHAKLETDVKMGILQAYIADTIDVVVATTAFGMGVDKPNIRQVIHYEISDSLENYAQEAGRGARDPKLRARCPLLFDPNDLDKHFMTLNRTRINVDEINAVFRVLKKDLRNPVMLTPREIASRAGWDTENGTFEVKVKTAILELEREGYVSRRRNVVRFYADAVMKNGSDRLAEATTNLDDATAIRHARVLQAILGSGIDRVQVDELTELLGYPHEAIASSILDLIAMGVINDAKDLNLAAARDGLIRYGRFRQIEIEAFHFLVSHPSERIRLGQLHQHLCKQLQTADNLMAPLKTILKSWRERSDLFTFKRLDRQRELWHFTMPDVKALETAITKKQATADRLIRYFFDQLTTKRPDEKQAIAFSMMQLREVLETKNDVFIDKALLRLHELGVIELGSGRFIYYAPMTLEKKGKLFIKNKRYTKADYKKRMEPYYRRKMESIHIAGEYADRLIRNGDDAARFLKHFFTLSSEHFLRKYDHLKTRFRYPITPQRLARLIDTLSPAQRSILSDDTSQAIMILAGPGSGKTRVLVHKMASLILRENVKPEQFLMLTYSRTAMLEFRARLFDLIGQAAYDTDIYTFHGYALLLLGRQVDDELGLEGVIAAAARDLRAGMIEAPFKTVIVLDEFQDINADGFAFVEALAQGQKKRLIAVGDDDQCILKQVNGADVRFFAQFETAFGQDEEGTSRYKSYQLLTNYRSRSPVVQYANAFADAISQRFKTEALTAQALHSGKVRIVRCQSPHLHIPALEEVRRLLRPEETLAVLAYSNNEVADLYAMLRDEGIEADYLLGDPGFRLRDLAEIRHFNAFAQGGDFDETHLMRTYAKTVERFRGSKNLPRLKKIILSFIREHAAFSPSLWEQYLDALEHDDRRIRNHRVFAATIHKSKGKEFDNVVLIAHKCRWNDDLRRLYYVGITRAKQNLVIVTDDAGFEDAAPGMTELVTDGNAYPEPAKKMLVMGLRDVNLGFTGNQELHESEPLIAGSKALLAQTGTPPLPYLIVQNGYVLAQLSKKMQEKVRALETGGYRIADVELENVVYWRDKQTETQRLQPLCKIVLQRI